MQGRKNTRDAPTYRNFNNTSSKAVATNTQPAVLRPMDTRLKSNSSRHSRVLVLAAQAVAGAATSDTATATVTWHATDQGQPASQSQDWQRSIPVQTAICHSLKTAIRAL
jgi:hypothetical protein